MTGPDPGQRAGPGEDRGAVLALTGRDGRVRARSGGPWEARYGCSRAIDPTHRVEIEAEARRR
jgi:hypothetical protein